MLNRASSISSAVIFFPSKRTSFAFAIPTVNSRSTDSSRSRDYTRLTATNKAYARPSLCDNSCTKCQYSACRTRSRHTQERERDRKVRVWKGVDEIKMSKVRCFLDQKNSIIEPTCDGPAAIPRNTKRETGTEHGPHGTYPSQDRSTPRRGSCCACTTGGRSGLTHSGYGNEGRTACVGSVLPRVTRWMNVWRMLRSSLLMLLPTSVPLSATTA